MRVGSLFSGVGMADLALEQLGCRTIWFSEVEEYPRSVMRRRFPDALDLGDVREIGRTVDAPEVDILVGGFPCQDISNAGARAGITGARSSLWGEFARLIDQLQPSFVFVENVSALLGRGLDVVLRDLWSIGYFLQWDCIPAAAVGAPHLRDRWWGVATQADAANGFVFNEPDAFPICDLREVDTVPAKLPRAGLMRDGLVYEAEPVAPRRTKRLGGGRSRWAGVHLFDGDSAPVLIPTPVARDWKGAGMKGQLGTMAAEGDFPLWPTPTASSPAIGADLEVWQASTDRLKEKGYNANGRGVPLAIAVQQAEVGMWPTPRAQDAKHAAATEYELGRDSGKDLLHVRVARVDQGLWPTPGASDGSGGRVSSELGGVRPSGAKRSVTLATAVAHDLWPTAVASDAIGSRRATARADHWKSNPGVTLLDAVIMRTLPEELWPTPRGSSGKSESGGGEGGTYVRTPSQQKGTHGRYLQVEAFEATMPGTTAEERKQTGQLNPDWVEWLMGLPIGWTNVETDAGIVLPWATDPHPYVPRISTDAHLRRPRLTAIGNGLVAQAMLWVAARALDVPIPVAGVAEVEDDGEQAA